MATTLEKVAAWLGMDQPTEAERTQLAAVTVAANEVAQRYAEGVDPGSLDLAATMLAARLHRRRNSPEGVAAITDTGASFVARTDPDIARLLRIDASQLPQVG